jgi:hypothetical protein
MGSTNYSKQEVLEARDGLRLLKNRMRDSQRTNNNNSSHSATRQEPVSYGSEKGGENRKSNYRSGMTSNTATKPPMMPTSTISTNNQSNFESTGEYNMNLRNKQIQL